MNLLKRVFCLIGNYLPPRLNSFFYKLSGANFNISKVWIGNKCYFDTKFPENIIIKDNVCLSFGVTIICHFDPTGGIKKHPIKKYKNKVIIEEGVFIGPNSIIMPGVTIRKNTFVRAGSVITKSTNPNTIVYGNPQKEGIYLNDKSISKINNLNKKYFL
jgi:acetyltransferase-like isoleucine patch superfamily enzyme